MRIINEIRDNGVEAFIGCAVSLSLNRKSLILLCVMRVALAVSWWCAREHGGFDQSTFPISFFAEITFILATSNYSL
jgi:hypothetical protein